MIRVISAMDGMPAAAAGIKPQDHIIAIDGKAVEGQEFNEAIDKMRGPVGHQGDADGPARGREEAL